MINSWPITDNRAYVMRTGEGYSKYFAKGMAIYSTTLYVLEFLHRRIHALCMASAVVGVLYGPTPPGVDLLGNLPG